MLAARPVSSASEDPVATNLLVWLDLEMTGLDPYRERILEIAAVVTSAELEVVAEGPSLVVHQPDEVLDGMGPWCTEHHGASGLTERVRASTLGEEEAERQILEFVAAHCAEATAPLAGNSVHTDRAFLARYMPRLDGYLHYRIVDVSTVKEVVRRWYPSVFSRRPRKKSTHRALDDIVESIEELRFYRDRVFRPPAASAP